MTYEPYSAEEEAIEVVRTVSHDLEAAAARYRERGQNRAADNCLAVSMALDDMIEGYEATLDRESGVEQDLQG